MSTNIARTETRSNMKSPLLPALCSGWDATQRAKVWDIVAMNARALEAIYTPQEVVAAETPPAVCSRLFSPRCVYRCVYVGVLPGVHILCVVPEACRVESEREFGPHTQVSEDRLSCIQLTRRQ